jgi:hypothetical protein
MQRLTSLALRDRDGQIMYLLKQLVSHYNKRAPGALEQDATQKTEPNMHESSRISHLDKCRLKVHFPLILMGLLASSWAC